MEEDIDYALFRISRLEKRIKSLELSAFMMPVCSVDLAEHSSFTRNFCCYRSNSALKIFCYSQNSATLTVSAGNDSYSFTVSPAVMKVIPLKKGNNVVNVTSTSTGGHIVLELTEVN